MSKLIERLKQVAEGRAQPMGFGTAARRTERSALVLVASLSNLSATTASLAAKGGADAVLAAITDVDRAYKEVRQTTPALADIPWGVSVESLTKEGLAQLLEMRCDFIVFDPSKTPAAVLREEGIGKVLELEPSLEDGLIRAADRLPIDAVLLRGEMEEPSLSVHRLMVCQRLVTLLRKPVLVAASSGMLGADLEALSEVGVRGVLVDMGMERPEERLLQVRQAIDIIPTGRKGLREKVDVVLPPPGELAGISEPEEEEEV